MIAWRSWAVIQAEPRTGSTITRAGCSAVLPPILAISAPLEKIGLKSAAAMFHYSHAASSLVGSHQRAGRRNNRRQRVRIPRISGGAVAMAIPTHVKYLIIGAGIHGLST